MGKGEKVFFAKKTLGGVVSFPFFYLSNCLNINDNLPGLVGLSLSYAMQITQNLNMLIRQTSMIENNMVSVERIREYQTGLPQEAPWSLPTDPKEDWPHRGEVVFRGYETRSAKSEKSHNFSLLQYASVLLQKRRGMSVSVCLRLTKVIWTNTVYCIVVYVRKNYFFTVRYE